MTLPMTLHVRNEYDWTQALCGANLGPDEEAAVVPRYAECDDCAKEWQERHAPVSDPPDREVWESWR